MAHWQSDEERLADGICPECRQHGAGAPFQLERHGASLRCPNCDRAWSLVTNRMRRQTARTIDRIRSLQVAAGTRQPAKGEQR